MPDKKFKIVIKDGVIPANLEVECFALPEYIEYNGTTFHKQGSSNRYYPFKGVCISYLKPRVIVALNQEDKKTS